MYNTTCEFCNNTFSIKSYYFFCSKCGKLSQLLNNISYFIYLDLPVVFPVNKDILEEHYIKLFSLYHPDNFVKNDKQEQLNAINHSSYLNKAYLTLKNDSQAISYIYELNTGKTLDLEGETSKELASFFFNLNEEFDALVSKRQKNNFRNKIKTYYNELIDEISNAFRAKEYQSIKEELFNKLKYIERLQNRL